MRNGIRALVAASFVLASGTGWAQKSGSEFEGLDLSSDKSAEPAKKDETTAAPVAEERRAKPAEAPKSGESAESLVIQEDRVKSVQKKLYVKRLRFELAPYFAFSVNDPFYTKVGPAIRAAFYFSDNVALSARFTLMQTLPTDDVRAAKRSFQSRIFYSVPFWTAMADFEWSPFYGKLAFWNSIFYLDAYLLGGLGVVNTETAIRPDRGISPAFDLGLGLRFVVKDWLAINAALINTTYVDQPTGTTQGVTQNLMMAYVGLSIFIPFRSTYREAE